MHTDPPGNDDLPHQLPLPLAKLCRRARNAKSDLDRQLAAYYWWEAAVKLLASVAVVEYAESGQRDPKLDERLTRLARPSLGDWWELVRLLVPQLAAGGDAGFVQVRELLFGRTRDDLPRAAGLDALLRDALEGRGGARNTVQLTELFDRLVRYRNKELGHGAAGQRSGDFYQRMSAGLVAGLTELFSRLDPLAGRRLVFVHSVQGEESGGWLVERFELIGETASRIDPVKLPESAPERARPGRVYVQRGNDVATCRQLHPLVVFDFDGNDAYFLNARRGKRRVEYLCYTSGTTIDREQLGSEQRELLARVLQLHVDDATEEAWQALSQAEEPTLVVPAARQRTLGEFELFSKLGHGGMGIVYRAWQPSLGRQVALKCLMKTGDPKVEARFAREIRSLGRVEHPNLVKIYTAGAEGDQWFYAMELVEGANLADICGRLAGSSATSIGRGEWQAAISTACEATRTNEELLAIAEQAPSPSPPSEQLPEKPFLSPNAGRPHADLDHVNHVIEIVRQVAEAAQALHESGVIHRDIKPGNIMLSPDGSRAVLVDLGLAQLADETQKNLTRTSQFVGTLRYASPEQVTARYRLDARNDVYSLGAVLWELLTLQPLYGVTEETPSAEIMKRIQFDEPGPVRPFCPAASRDLEAIVLKCLEKNPAGRYASAQALAVDLLHAQRGQSVTARPPGHFRRIVKWGQKYALAASWIVLVIGLMGALTWTGWQVWSSPAGQHKLRVEDICPNNTLRRGNWGRTGSITFPYFPLSPFRKTLRNMWTVWFSWTIPSSCIFTPEPARLFGLATVSQRESSCSVENLPLANERQLG